MAVLRRATVRGLVVTATLALVLAGPATPAQAVGEVDVDARYRHSVANAYNDVLVPALRTPTAWSGSTSPCAPGSESAYSRLATLKAINFMRGMVQLSPVIFSTTGNGQATRAALLMDANDMVSHYPTQSAFSSCWSTTGKTMAGRSNLALAWGSGLNDTAPTTGARAITAYMKDSGSSNVAVGHRRWLLNPTTRVMATGSTSTANALVVTGYPKSTSAKRPTYMEWPSAGWFPQQIEPGGRWSLSASSTSYSFKYARVKVQRVDSSGRAVQTLTATKRTPTGGMGPNTLVFDVSGVAHPTGTAAAYYKVTVTGIRKGTYTTSYTYTVKLFDPTAF